MLTSHNKDRSLLSILIIAVFSLAFPIIASADIYMYRDSQGVLHLGNSNEARKKGQFFLKESPRSQSEISKDKKEIVSLIEKTAKKHSVDPDLAKAIAKAESSFNTAAVSPKGAIGVMQLMPGTASRFKVKDIYHPEDNIDGGIRYLKLLINMFPKDVRLAIAAYNAGENRVIKSGYKIPEIRETQEYVDRVVRYYNAYKKSNGKESKSNQSIGRPVTKKVDKNGILVLSNL